MRQALSKAALVQKLLEELRGGPGTRDLAAIDVHLRSVSGAPNWDAEVDDVDAHQLDEAKRKLSHYDLKEDE
jgi:hypothetical protein